VSPLAAERRDVRLQKGGIAVRCFVIGIVGFICAGVLAAIVIPSYGDFTSRASLSETMVAIRPLREKVAEALSKDPKTLASLSSSATKEPITGVNFLKVAADGTIAFRRAKHGQLIIFEPVVRNGAITLKRVGSPPKHVPPDCR